MVAQSPPFALQNAAHSAALFRQAVSSPFTAAGGVLSPSDFAVAAQSTPNMSVQVAAGRVWIPGTQVANVAGGSFSTQAAYFGLNDAPVTLTVAAADPTNPRIDLVFVAVADSFYQGATNTLTLGIVTGTPAATPVAPSPPSNALSLGTLAVAANATSIGSANIAQLVTVGLLRGQDWPIASLRQTTAITNQTGWNTLAFQAASLDTAAGWSVSPNPTRWTVPAGQGGTYAVEGCATLAALTAGTYVNARITKNGSVFVGSSGSGLSVGSSSANNVQTGRKILKLAAGDYVELQATASTTWSSTVSFSDAASTMIVERIA